MTNQVGLVCSNFLSYNIIVDFFSVGVIQHTLSLYGESVPYRKETKWLTQTLKDLIETRLKSLSTTLNLAKLALY